MPWVTKASDDFNRASGGVGANWTTWEIVVNAGGLVVAQNRCTAQGSTWQFSGSYYSAVAPNDNQRITATATASKGASYWYMMFIRWTGGATKNGYYAQFDGGGATNVIYRVLNGVSGAAILVAGSKPAITANMQVRMTAEGSLISVETNSGAGWSTRMSVTNSEIPSGGTGGLAVQNWGDQHGWDNMLLEENRIKWPLPSFRG